MIANGIGGANTRTGLIFEGKVDLATFLSQQNGYVVDSDGKVFYYDELVAQIFKKHKFYSFLQERGLNWRDIISKKLLPDDSIYIIINTHFLSLSASFSELQDRLMRNYKLVILKRNNIKNFSLVLIWKWSMYIC